MDRVERIKEMLTTNPHDSFLNHALALEYIKAGDDAGAQLLFEQLLQREPGYVGSYYHLAKLLERNGKEQEAIAIYEKGMHMAKEKGEQHAFNELRSAWEELTF
ncbi:MAG: tetratricopeptide repeat protein [Chitinophagaceae bacterium]|nr:tetratricopeptide repeat protein [Chitinophagaceae bacterium]